MLGKLPVPGRPTNLDNSRERIAAICAYGGLFGHFRSLLLVLSSFSFSGRRSDIVRNTV